MAYLRIVRGEFDPAKYDEVWRIMGELSAAAEGLPGFRQALGGFDRAAGGFIAIGVFDTLD